MKVATRPVTISSETDAGITEAKLNGPGPFTVKVPAVIVVGSMRAPEGTPKLALIAAPGQTPVAPAVGLVESTEMLAGATAPAVRNVQT